MRFGGVNIKKQKGFGNDTYHSPPSTKGFYAFPLCAQEFFLIGSLGDFQKGTMPKSPKGENLLQEDWDNFRKRNKRALSVKRKEFIKKKGNIWHHLLEYSDRNEIIAEYGSWCKTSIKTWQKAFSRMSIECRYGEDSFKNKSINNSRGIVGFYSKDHCEVFFDEKV